MDVKKFSSPREEALDIAQSTTKDILEGKRDIVSILRACWVIAKRLNKSSEEEWLVSELSGYKKDVKLPSYRQIECHYKTLYGISLNGSRKTNISLEIYLIESQNKRKEDIMMEVSGVVAVIDTLRQDRIISAVTDRCLSFLNDVTTELQYGGIVDYLMEEIRNNVDEKLAKLDSNSPNEITSLCSNLSSTNPADWPKVGLSCISILKSLADRVFPAQKDKYTAKNGEVYAVDDSKILNRLLAFVDQELTGDRNQLLQNEIKYLEPYISQVIEFAQMGKHNNTLEKFDANMIAIHTYLIISEILKLVPPVDKASK